MKFSQVSSAVMLATLPISGVFAAALDRSGQPMNAFFQDGNYFEANLSVLDPTVSGKEVNNNLAQNGGNGREIKDMGEDYMFPTAALKIQPHEKVSVALLYDQPFGANAKYSGENKFVSNPAEAGAIATATVANLERQTQLYLDNINALTGGNFEKRHLPDLAQHANVDISTGAKRIIAAQQGLVEVQTKTAKTANPDITGTNVDVTTETLSLVVGYQPTKNWNVYAGPVYQNVKADVNLRGTAYSVLDGYDLHVSKNGAVGWLAGAAYSRPDIALRAAVTYRSEIDHEFNAKENLTALQTTAESKLTTPQSVNLDLQSGVAPDTLAFINVRWVDWSSFKFQPNRFGQVSRLAAVQAQTGKPEFNLVQYSKDQISATVGVGRKFSDRWSGNFAVGWDSGAGNPVTTLGPTKGYWNTGLGLQYSPAKNYFIAGGVKYFWLGDAKAQSGAQAGTENFIGEFKDNKAIAYGLKIGYRF